MAGYRDGSGWSDLNELKCLLAYKQLEEENFPRGKLSALAEEISRESGLGVRSIKAKIGNYKSVAGITENSNASRSTISMYRNYGHLTSSVLKILVLSGK